MASVLFFVLDLLGFSDAPTSSLGSNKSFWFKFWISGKRLDRVSDAWRSHSRTTLGVTCIDFTVAIFNMGH